MDRLDKLKARYEELEHEKELLRIDIERLEREEMVKRAVASARKQRNRRRYRWRPKGDELRYEMGNYFKTKEEAEHWVETLRVWAELKVYSIDKTDTENDRYYIRFDSLYNVFNFELGMGSTAHADLAFPTIERAEQAIKEVGEERVKRYYLGVK